MSVHRESFQEIVFFLSWGGIGGMSVKPTGSTRSAGRGGELGKGFVDVLKMPWSLLLALAVDVVVVDEELVE